MNKEIEWLLKEKYRGEKSEGFFTDCERLAGGEPLAYVIGHVPFLDCQIWLDSKPLIPRPETEFWVEKAIKTINNIINNNPLTLQRTLLGKTRDSKLYQGESFVEVLDLCAGSGAIGVATAKAIPEAYVTFAELDLAHLPTIQKNLTFNTVIYDRVGSQRTKLIQSDLFLNIDGIFDFILCNPPYIDAAANTVDESVATNEPHLALFGGEGGMEVIAWIIAGARAKLAPHTGQLWLEHEPFQTAAIAALAHQHGFTVATHLDQYGTVRYSVLTYPVAK